MARLQPGINAGSMADIAFLLLIFFLVTATMDVDSGLRRRLPPLPVKGQEPTAVARRNVFEILINAHDELLINGKRGELRDIRPLVTEFISNAANDPAKAEKEWLSQRKKREANQGNFEEVTRIDEAMELIGDYPVSKGIISLQNDRATSYGMYVNVQNELTAAFKKLRDQLSVKHFGIAYSRLRDTRQIQAIEKAIPMNISKAEPVDTGGEP